MGGGGRLIISTSSRNSDVLSAFFTLFLKPISGHWRGVAGASAGLRGVECGEVLQEMAHIIQHYTVSFLGWLSLLLMCYISSCENYW